MTWQRRLTNLSTAFRSTAHEYNWLYSIMILPHMIRRQSRVAGLVDSGFQDIALFKERVEKLDAAQKKYQNVPMSKTTRDSKGRVIAFDANTPTVDDVINIAVKFRFFYAEKEPTYFEKVTNQIRPKCSDEFARNYIDWVRRLYKESMEDTSISAEWGHPVTNRELINLWFNSDFFHSDAAKREKLKDINQRIGEHGSLFQLYVAIVRCASHVKSFYAVIHRLEQGHEYIYTPDHHFRFAE